MEFLLETSVSQPDSSAHETYNFPESDKMEVFSLTEGTGDAKNLEKATIDVASNGKASEPSSSDSSSGENTGGFWSRHNLDNVFLPTYNENLRDLGTSDPEVDMVLQTFKLDHPTDDIFRIWDLDIPPEEDDLIKHLNEAKPSQEVLWSQFLRFLMNLRHEKLEREDLISGINELSLSPN